MTFPASSPIGWMTDCAARFRFKVNFGQLDAWFPPPQGFVYISQLPVLERVRGMRCPERKADCEVRLELVCWNPRNSGVGSKHEAQLLTELSFKKIVILMLWYSCRCLMLQFYSHHVLFSLKEVYHHSFSKLVVGQHKSCIQC